MEIKILGTGCPKCKTLEKLTRDVVAENNIDATISKEEDIMKIMEYGVMQTPGIVIDGKVVLSGRLPSSSELLNLLTSK
ncbi:MAG: thioredoxin family protein [Bacteroidota bacterium]